MNEELADARVQLERQLETLLNAFVQRYPGVHVDDISADYVQRNADGPREYLVHVDLSP